jgi:hypothetical protein
MNRSTYENPLPQKYYKSAATGYRTSGDEVEGKWPIYPEMAAAGLWTTPSQLIQYAIEIQKIHQKKKDGILKYETVEEMLTPGMNDHGLGPGVSEHTFGHGGADEGFRAQLTAWKDSPHAIVIMINSDNGKIIRELMLAVAEEYDLPGIEPNIKKIVRMSSEELERYTGNYEIDEYGLLNIQILADHLTIDADFDEATMHIFSENDPLFFDKNNGMSIDFDMEEGIVTGFMVQGSLAKKL